MKKYSSSVSLLLTDEYNYYFMKTGSTLSKKFYLCYVYANNKKSGIN